MRLVVVDDSIVRGNTMKRLVAALRHQGAKEIHLRSSSPPLRHPCYFGIDIPQEEELIAAGRSVEEIAAYIGVDSLGYLSTTGLGRALASDMAMQIGADTSAVGAIHQPLQDAAADTLLHDEFCYGCMEKRGWPFDPLAANTTHAMQFVSLNAMR
jgi:amidophosphoribosyltransferase